MKRIQKFEKIARTGDLIQGDGWTIPSGLFRPATLECGHIKLFNHKRKLKIGDRKLCDICTHESFEAGISYNMSRAIRERTKS